jgi:soluble lytic murein transglycosylase-like protein
VRLPRRRLRVGLPILLGCLLTASVPGLLHIRVRPGDTLWALAQRYHTSVAELVALNHLPGNGNLIYAGQLLEVPGAAAPTPAARDRTAIRWRPYRVVAGDCLYCIAARFHANPLAIAERNHLPASMVVELGQVLYVPQLVRVAPPAAPPAGGEWWSRTSVRELIVHTARAFGVDPALALAVSWQESGFQQDIVSGAGAIGAMQVMPATGRFVAGYVVDHGLDLYDAPDNVIAGVAMLSVLLRAGSVADAVAGYYQGLGSVRAHGMYPDTRRYVADVLALRSYFASSA